MKLCGFSSMNLVFLSCCLRECRCLERFGERTYVRGWVLGELDGKESGVSTGDLSPLGQLAHITLLWSTTHTQHTTLLHHSLLPPQSSV